MYDITLDVTARTALVAVRSVLRSVQAVDLTTVALSLAAVAAVLVITAVVSTFAEAHARRLSNRSYHVGPTGSGDDAVGAVTALILVIVVVVAAMLIGVPL